MLIEERKIIHILLKHLMDQKNEISYLKNKAALNAADNNVPELTDGAKVAVYSNQSLTDGAKGTVHSHQELTDGAKDAVRSHQESTDGAKGTIYSNNDITDGAKGAVRSHQESTDGAKGAVYSNNDLSDGAKGAIYGNQDLSEGAKGALDGIPILPIEGNGGALLYSVFEKGLLNALDDYIKNGNGQNTLFTFYTDFVEAVEAQNLAAAKSKDATTILLLEDTHTLPLQITTTGTSFARFGEALNTNLPRHFNGEMYKTLAHELLLLHNAGKATSSELSGFSGLSAAGHRKHLTKLVSLGLIKRQAPWNYVLTDKSNHILLELFGIPKKIDEVLKPKV